MKLTELYEDLPPENEQIWSFIGLQDYLSLDFTILAIDPVIWASYPAYDGSSLLDRFQTASKKQKEIVARYRRLFRAGKDIDPVVISTALDMVIDGQHRVIAAALEQIETIPALDISEDT